MPTAASNTAADCVCVCAVYARDGCRVSVQLPVYIPSEEEKRNPRLYADNVHAVMVSLHTMSLTLFS